jgi:hypothetical protein
MDFFVNDPAGTNADVTVFCDGVYRNCMYIEMRERFGDS